MLMEASSSVNPSFQINRSVLSPHSQMLMSPDGRERSINFFLSQRFNVSQNTERQINNIDVDNILNDVENQIQQYTSRSNCRNNQYLQNREILDQQQQMRDLQFQFSNENNSQPLNLQQQNFNFQVSNMQQSEQVQNQNQDKGPSQNLQQQIGIYHLYSLEQLKRQDYSRNIFKIILIIMTIIVAINILFILSFVVQIINQNNLIILGTILLLSAAYIKTQKLCSNYLIAEIIFMSLFFQALYLNTQIKKFPNLMLIFYWPFVHIMGWIQRNIKVDNDSEEDDYQVIYLIFGLRCLIFVQALMILLKIDSFVQFNWVSIFVPTIIILVLTTIICIQTFYYLLKNIRKKNPIVNNIGLQWETGLLISTYACSWILLIGVLLLLQSNFQNMILASLVTNAIVGFIMIIFSKKHSLDLIYFMSDCPTPQEMIKNLNTLKVQQQNQQNVENQSNEIEQPQINQNMQNDQLNESNPQKSHQVINQISQFFSKIAQRPPSYLIKMSQTYFKITFQDKNQLLQDKKKQKEQEKEIKKQKQKIEQKQKKILINKIQSESQIDRQEQKDSEHILFKNSNIHKFKSLTQLTFKNQNQNSQANLQIKQFNLNQNNLQKENKINEISVDCSSSSKSESNNDNLKISENKNESLNNQTSINTNNNDLSKSAEGQKNKRSEVTCVVCFENPPNSVFMNCGHGGICKQCALDISIKTGMCFLCREPIKQIIRVKDTQSNKKYQEIASIIYIDTNPDNK
ncbi:zinc finger, C3HC4 type (RING finger) protein (macronuclear) [Tetrahymena thermophila SB210]|uniref:Zinc finger, C3HC4 type (RING finger) protein n=1 Tax=Tetrahymena thermophila (strain SB210) TaxID=312017 RepID=I7MIN9_TETTS|nr:zinc finger, C3HC4 type (RING finger) protein [Tetrahymena thermophila SB210]EAR93893.2 zinc finger, C3HC4 type (RING finger) protein [Tetrahymena thermophila SB210]|eukprot:XP_001014138.2 zinc finger, C3HC4 type (RING finger) protein [Tetrahymena thermophila SB210]